MDLILSYTVCSRCGGRGVKYLPSLNGIAEENPCSLCGGTGKETVDEIDVALLMSELKKIKNDCKTIIKMLKKTPMNTIAGSSKEDAGNRSSGNAGIPGNRL